jgi:hypothetical protein
MKEIRAERGICGKSIPRNPERPLLTIKPQGFFSDINRKDP